MKAIALALAILCFAAPAFADRHVDIEIEIDIDADNDTEADADKDRSRKASISKVLSEVNVNLVGIVAKDFIDPPTVDQVFSSLRGGAALGGIGWEVVIKRFGLGGSYLVLFEPDENDSWWFNWEVQPIFSSFHPLGGGSRIDPFVDAGLGCAGRVYLGPTYISGDRLGISIYPFGSAGLALNLDTFRIGAKVSVMPWQSRLPATPIPGYEVGTFQVQIFAGASLGQHR